MQSERSHYAVGLALWLAVSAQSGYAAADEPAAPVATEKIFTVAYILQQRRENHGAL